MPEDDDVAALHVLIGQQVFADGIRGRIGQLIDDQVVAGVASVLCIDDVGITNGCAMVEVPNSRIRIVMAHSAMELRWTGADSWGAALAVLSCSCGSHGSTGRCDSSASW